jgi:predicted nucleic acid-binding protein
VAGVDFDAVRRWARFDPQRTLARRPDKDLPFVANDTLAGQGLLLDTCVYVDQMQDRSPAIIEELIAQRQVNHSMIAVQEMMHSVGALRPEDARTPHVIAEISKQIQAMPQHRMLTPEPDTLAKSALLSGMLSRVQSYANDHKLRALNDCVLFLQALKHGLVVLTANTGDYDILSQLIPQGRVLFYRQEEQTGRPS